MEKDLFKGVEYDLIEPKEGDIVRVNIHRCPAYCHRDYVLVIYPSEGDIEEDNRQFIFHCKRYVGYIGRIQCGKVYIYKDGDPTLVRINELGDLRRHLTILTAFCLACSCQFCASAPITIVIRQTRAITILFIILLFKSGAKIEKKSDIAKFFNVI